MSSPTPAPRALVDAPECTDVAADLITLMASPDLASRRWICEQYDHMVGADTVQRPGGDAAVVRVHGTQKGLATATRAISTPSSSSTGASPTGYESPGSMVRTSFGKLTR